jgi:hypothetical protein
MRSGDLAALVKGYTDLKATAPKKQGPEYKKDLHLQNTGYTYFDVTF